MLLGHRCFHIRNIFAEVLFHLSAGKRRKFDLAAIFQQDAQRILHQSALILPFGHILPEQDVTTIRILRAVKDHIAIVKLAEHAVVADTELVTGQHQYRDADDLEKNKTLIGASGKVIKEIYGTFLIFKINEADKTEIESRVFTDYEDQFQWFIGAAILLLILEIMLASGKKEWENKFKFFDIDNENSK